MKKVIQVSSLLLCFTLIISVADSVQAKKASELTSPEIQELEDQIQDAEDEIDGLKNSLSDVQGLVDELEGAKTNLNNYVEALDGALLAIEEKIADLEAQIVQKEADIAEAQARLEQAQKTEAEQYAAMSNRIKYVYEKGSTNYVQILLQASDSADLLNRLTYVDAIMSYDQDRLEEFIANKEYIDLCERQLQAEKEYLDAMKACVQNEMEATETLIATKGQEILAYEQDISNKEQAIAEYEAEIAEQTELIQALEKAVEEEKKKLIDGGGLLYDGGIFAFPLESYTRVSDDYGPRIHPILNTPQFHNGVDFAAPKGTKIFAAYDGKVVAATYSSSMGNYVMIDHGSGLYTIYMHASKLYVSKDDVVVKGQHIAGVGSTGRSTGNHLHFSVRLNGEYVSPWDYLKK